MKKWGGRSINEDTEGYVGDTTHDIVDETDGESQVSEDHSDVEPIGVIESFCEVQLQNNTLELFSFDGMESLLGSAYCLMDLTMVEESKLFR